MFSGDTMKTNIPETLCSLLGGSSVNGWVDLLLRAMDQQPRATSFPSILILDSFNSVGENEVNIEFIRALYERMQAQKNIFVVVLTQDKKVAQELFKANGGARIIPLPGSMEGTTDEPSWEEEKWTVDELIKLVHYKEPGAYTDDQIREFVSPDMTPLDVNKKLSGKRTRKKPDSPRKKQVI